MSTSTYSHEQQDAARAILHPKATRMRRQGIMTKPKQKTLVPMTNAARIRAYARTNGQPGKFRPTPAQQRRIMKHARKGRG